MLDVLVARRVDRHPDAVEAHAVDAPIAREAVAPEALGRCAEAEPLARVDRVERANERARAPRAHLDDDYDRLLAREHINLVPPDAHVRAEDLEALLEEVRLRGALRADAEVACFDAEGREWMQWRLIPERVPRAWTWGCSRYHHDRLRAAGGGREGRSASISFRRDRPRSGTCRFRRHRT